MTVETTWTIQRLLDWTTDFFKSKHLDPARLSAEILLAEALHCQRIDLYTRFDEVPAEPALATYRDWVKRHASGEPVAYLVGHREFYSLKFDVTSDVLIPRPETEHVVMAALDAAKSFGSDLNIVDVGTGSGAIAITLATQLEKARIYATDISPAALKIARKNAQAHGVMEQIEFLEGNLLDPIAPEICPEIIVSNPPYIGRSEVDTVDPSVREHEPDIALFAGENGTDIIAPLIAASAAKIAPGGFLIFETSPIIFDRCLELVESNQDESGFEAPQTIKDFSGHRRVIQVCKSV